MFKIILALVIVAVVTIVIGIISPYFIFPLLNRFNDFIQRLIVGLLIIIVSAIVYMIANTVIGITVIQIGMAILALYLIGEVIYDN